MQKVQNRSTRERGKSEELLVVQKQGTKMSKVTRRSCTLIATPALAFLKLLQFYKKAGKESVAVMIFIEFSRHLPRFVFGFYAFIVHECIYLMLKSDYRLLRDQ